MVTNLIIIPFSYEHTVMSKTKPTFLLFSFDTVLYAFERDSLLSEFADCI